MHSGYVKPSVRRFLREEARPSLSLEGVRHEKRDTQGDSLDTMLYLMVYQRVHHTKNEYIVWNAYIVEIQRAHRKKN